MIAVEYWKQIFCGLPANGEQYSHYQGTGVHRVPAFNFLINNMKERTGMPIPPFFIPDENGDIKISFNGQNICKEELIKARECLDLFLKETSDKDIKIYNLENEEYWRNEMNAVATDSYKVKKPPKEGYIYILKSLSLYKIGRAKDIKGRLKAYTTENPHGIEVIYVALVKDYIQVETELLKMFSENKKNGKEWFSLNHKNIEHIIKFLETKQI